MKKKFLVFALFMSVVLSSCGIASHYATSVYDDAVYYKETYREDKVLAEAKEYLENYDRDIYALSKGETYEQRLNKFKEGSTPITINYNISIDNDPWYNPWWGSAYGWNSPWYYHNYLSWNNHTWLWNLRWNVSWSPYWGWDYCFGSSWYDPWWGGYYPYYHWYPGHHHHWYPPIHHPGHIGGKPKNIVYGKRESVLPYRVNNSGSYNASNGIRSGSSYSQIRNSSSSSNSNRVNNSSIDNSRQNNVRDSRNISNNRNEAQRPNYSNVRQGTSRETQRQPVQNNSSFDVRNSSSINSGSSSMRSGTSGAGFSGSTSGRGSVREGSGIR